ncbi:hypothetical protein MesoLj131a_39960 [Mesorhizobium sp. 131-2-1]|nr:hypothetical protein MesoLj131a_39960 [Mesorhizobium sp. 131-2-1]
MGHLHNGDPLLLRTVHVPSNRPPKPWPTPGVDDPRELWQESAKDALKRISGLVPEWNFPRMCFGLEAYNGFGYRPYNINTPYLWSFTNRYSGGGYPRDHVFDRSYRSKQAGLVALINAISQIDPTVQIKMKDESV